MVLTSACSPVALSLRPMDNGSVLPRARRQGWMVEEERCPVMNRCEPSGRSAHGCPFVPSSQ